MTEPDTSIVIDLKNTSLKIVVPIGATALTLAHACATLIDDYFKVETIAQGKQVMIAQCERVHYIEQITPKLVSFVQEGCRYETSVIRGVTDNHKKCHTFYMTLQQVKLYHATH